MTRFVFACALLGCGAEPPVASAPPPPPPSLFANDEGAKKDPPPANGLQFDDVTTAWAIDVRHHAGRHADKWLPEMMGGGIALLDVDRNGALDVLFVDSGDLTSNAPGPDVGPHLLLGDGKGGFTDVTAAWGLTHAGYGMGIAAGDIDNDGFVDVYLTSYDARDRLLRNDGGKRFVDVTEAWGIAPRGWSTSAAFADIDRDGNLDLYVVRYVTYELEHAIKCFFHKVHMYCTPGMYEAQHDLLYRNDGGRFVDVSDTSGVAAHVEKGLAIGTGDLDGDRDTDFYVADDISRNLLLLNDGKGVFAEVGVQAGVAYSELGREEASMGVAISDVDGDDLWDIAITNFQAEPTSLYVRREGGTYRERSDAAGIGASSRARLGFGIEFFDADNDGDEDLVTANGHVTDNVADFRQNVDFEQLNSLYERVGDGEFVDVSAAAGSALAHRGASRGLAVGDLDGDGGLDFVVVDNDAPIQVARNTTASRGHFLSVWLEGGPSNRSAIGAVLTAKVGDRTLRREVRGGTSYLSVSDRRIHLGLGRAEHVDALRVRWPDGTDQDLGVQAADVYLHVVQGKTPHVYKPGAKVIAP